MNLLIKGGRIIDPFSEQDTICDIRIKNDKIVETGPGLARKSSEKLVDAGGMIVCPGLIDMHVHLREPGYEGKETIATGTRAAAKGGFTGVGAMPNTLPVADNPAVIEYVRKITREEGMCRVYPFGSITRDSRGENLAEIGELANAGAVAISDDGNPVESAEILRRALEYARAFNLPLVDHCEDRALSGEGVMHEGYVSTILGLKGISAASEEVVVARDIILAEMTGAHLHIAHVSTAHSVKMIREAKARGVPVTAEATPHHFTLTHEAVKSYDTATKVNPPLRTHEDVEAVIEGLADGTIDIIVSDHAPHSYEDKTVEYDAAPFGISGLETVVPLVVDRLILTGKISWARAVAALTSEPARIFGLPCKGIQEGSTADLTIIDPGLKITVEKDSFISLGKNTPFEGMRLQGWPCATIVGGNLVMFERKAELEPALS